MARPLPLIRNLNRITLSQRLRNTNFRVKPKLKNRLNPQKIVEIKHMQLAALNARIETIRKAFASRTLSGERFKQAQLMLRDAINARAKLVAELYGRERYNVKVPKAIYEERYEEPIEDVEEEFEESEVYYDFINDPEYLGNRIKYHHDLTFEVLGLIKNIISGSPDRETIISDKIRDLLSSLDLYGVTERIAFLKALKSEFESLIAQNQKISDYGEYLKRLESIKDQVHEQHEQLIRQRVNQLELLTEPDLIGQDINERNIDDIITKFIDRIFHKHQYRFSGTEVSTISEALKKDLKEISIYVGSQNKTKVFSFLELLLKSIKVYKIDKVKELIDRLRSDSNFDRSENHFNSRSQNLLKKFTTYWLESGIADLSILKKKKLQEDQKSILTEQEKKAVIDMPTRYSVELRSVSVDGLFSQKCAELFRELKLPQEQHEKIIILGLEFLNTIAIVRYPSNALDTPIRQLEAVFLGLFYEIIETKNPKKIIKFLENLNNELLANAMHGKLLSAIKDEQTGKVKELIVQREDLNDLAFSFAEELKKVKSQTIGTEDNLLNEIFENINKDKFYEELNGLNYSETNIVTHRLLMNSLEDNLITGIGYQISLKITGLSGRISGLSHGEQNSRYTNCMKLLCFFARDFKSSSMNKKIYLSNFLRFLELLEENTKNLTINNYPELIKEWSEVWNSNRRKSKNMEELILSREELERQTQELLDSFPSSYYDQFSITTINMVAKSILFKELEKLFDGDLKTEQKITFSLYELVDAIFNQPNAETKKVNQLRLLLYFIKNSDLVGFVRLLVGVRGLIKFMKQERIVKDHDFVRIWLEHKRLLLKEARAKILTATTRSIQETIAKREPILHQNYMQFTQLILGPLGIHHSLEPVYDELLRMNSNLSIEGVHIDTPVVLINLLGYLIKNSGHVKGTSEDKLARFIDALCDAVPKHFRTDEDVNNLVDNWTRIFLEHKSERLNKTKRQEITQGHLQESQNSERYNEELKRILRKIEDPEYLRMSEEMQITELKDDFYNIVEFHYVLDADLESKELKPIKKLIDKLVNGISIIYRLPSNKYHRITLLRILSYFIANNKFHDKGTLLKLLSEFADSYSRLDSKDIKGRTLSDERSNELFNTTLYNWIRIWFRYNANRSQEPEEVTVGQITIEKARIEKELRENTKEYNISWFHRQTLMKYLKSFDLETDRTGKTIFDYIEDKIKIEGTNKTFEAQTKLFRMLKFFIDEIGTNTSDTNKAIRQYNDLLSVLKITLKSPILTEAKLNSLIDIWVYEYLKNKVKSKLNIEEEPEPEFNVLEEIEKPEYKNKWFISINKPNEWINWLLENISLSDVGRPHFSDAIDKFTNYCYTKIQPKINGLDGSATDKLVKILKAYMTNFIQSKSYSEEKLIDFIRQTNKILQTYEHIKTYAEYSEVLEKWQKQYEFMFPRERPRVQSAKDQMLNEVQIRMNSAIKKYQRQLINLARGIEDPEIANMMAKFKSENLNLDEKTLSVIFESTNSLPEILKETFRLIVLSTMSEEAISKLSKYEKQNYAFIHLLPLLLKTLEHKDYGFFFRESLSLLKKFANDADLKPALIERFKDIIKEHPEILFRDYSIIDIVTNDLVPKDDLMLQLLFVPMPNSFKLRLYQKVLDKLDFKIKLNILQNKDDREFFIITLKDFFNLFGNTIETLKKLYSYLDKLKTESKLTVQATIVFLKSLNKQFALKELTDTQIDELFNLGNKIKAERDILNTRMVFKHLERLFIDNNTLKHLSNNLKYNIFSLTLNLTIKYPNHKDKIVHFLEASLKEALESIKPEKYDSMLVKRFESSLSRRVRFDLDRVIEMDDDKPNGDSNNNGSLHDERVKRIELDDSHKPISQKPFSDKPQVNTMGERIKRIEIDDDVIDDFDSRIRLQIETALEQELNKDDLEYLLRITNPTIENQSILDSLLKILIKFSKGNRNSLLTNLLELHKTKKYNIQRFIEFFNRVIILYGDFPQNYGEIYLSCANISKIFSKIKDFSKGSFGFNTFIDFLNEKFKGFDNDTKKRLVSLIFDDLQSKSNLDSILSNMDIILRRINKLSSGKELLDDLKYEFQLLESNPTEYLRLSHVEHD